MAELGKLLNGIQLKPPGAPLSAWAPLREPLFRSLWIAAVVCYTGRWILSVASGWLMTGLTLSPLMVALVQAASTLPAFLVLLPAGALADMVDRRHFLLVMQTWIVLAAAALGILTFLNLVTPWILLLFTFLIGFRDCLTRRCPHGECADRRRPAGRFLLDDAFSHAGPPGRTMDRRRRH